jgi:hypothetical protein
MKAVNAAVWDSRHASSAADWIFMMRWGDVKKDRCSVLIFLDKIIQGNIIESSICVPFQLVRLGFSHALHPSFMPMSMAVSLFC